MAPGSRGLGAGGALGVGDDFAPVGVAAFTIAAGLGVAGGTIGGGVGNVPLTEAPAEAAGFDWFCWLTFLLAGCVGRLAWGAAAGCFGAPAVPAGALDGDLSDCSFGAGVFLAPCLAGVLIRPSLSLADG